MTSIDYNSIYQGFYLRAEAYDFLDLNENTVHEFLCNWLHASIRPPYIRRLFSAITFDDDVMRLTYELKRPEEDEEDKDFVIELLVLGMVIEWLTPKVRSMTNVTNFYGSKEEKTFSPASHLKTLNELLDSLKKERRRMIGDRGYIYNAYVAGEDLTT